jgi:hypothetical protein
MRKYLYFASGFVSTILVLKLLFWKRPPPDDFSDLPSLEDPDEYITVKRTATSRSGHTVETEEIVKVPKLSQMKKDELIDECVRRNIACIGTVRVLRERLRKAREEKKEKA